LRGIVVQIADFSWLKNKNVDLPLSLDGRSWAKGTFRFLAPRKIRVVGSFMQDTCIRRHGNIDIAVEIPQVKFKCLYLLS
jgi:hypothetical protein